MIEYIEGDIFTSPAQVIVNTVNTVGVMGKGIALEFKKRYPQMFEVYKSACEKRKFTIGKLMLVSASDHMILLFPTKENWRYPSKLSYIEQGLKRFCDKYAERGITSIAFPKLGCGNGELSWDDVRPLMERYLKSLPIDVYIYLKSGMAEKPEHKQTKEMRSWLRNYAKDMSFNGVSDDIHQLCALVPYQFFIDNQKVDVTYTTDLCFDYQGKTYTIQEDMFFATWDDMRNKMIFSSAGVSKELFLLYHLMLSLGYISRIKKLDKSTGVMIDGFQLNDGLGRAFGLNEVRK